MRRVRQLRPGDARGASAVEYGLIVMAIAAVIAVVVFTLGTLTKANATSVCDNWKAVQADAC